MHTLPPLLPVAVQLPLPFAPETSFEARILPMAWSSRRTHPVLDALRRLLPVAMQLPLRDEQNKPLLREVAALERQLRQVCLTDALVFGVFRLEYIERCGGHDPEFRLYRSGRIVGAARVHLFNPERLKAALVPVLFSLGWTESAVIVRSHEAAACRRRATRRRLA